MNKFLVLSLLLSGIGVATAALVQYETPYEVTDCHDNKLGYLVDVNKDYATVLEYGMPVLDVSDVAKVHKLDKIKVVETSTGVTKLLGQHGCSK